MAASDDEHCLGIYVVPLVPGLHAVLEPVPPQTDARGLPHADQVCEVWSVLQYCHVTLKAQTILRFHDDIRRRRRSSSIPASPSLASKSCLRHDPSSTSTPSAWEQYQSFPYVLATSSRTSFLSFSSHQSVPFNFSSRFPPSTPSIP